MLKSKVEEYLGKYVEATLCDGFAYKGILKKTDDDLQRYCKNNYYYCDNYGDSKLMSGWRKTFHSGINLFLGISPKKRKRNMLTKSGLT